MGFFSKLFNLDPPLTAEERNERARQDAEDRRLRQEMLEKGREASKKKFRGEPLTDAEWAAYDFYEKECCY